MSHAISREPALDQDEIELGKPAEMLKVTIFRLIQLPPTLMDVANKPTLAGTYQSALA